MECSLLECVQRGLKTARRSTCVYIKRLPGGGSGCDSEDDSRAIFVEKLEEFCGNDRGMTVDDFIKVNSAINLDASGSPTTDLINYFTLPEYSMIDLTPLEQLGRDGNIVLMCNRMSHWIFQEARVRIGVVL